jgi:6-phosphogluconate dehydrogenase
VQLGIVGLGRMGANIARRVRAGGHECVVYDRRPAAVAPLAAEGFPVAASLDALVDTLARPRAVWVVVPAGAPTEETVMRLAELCDAGDTVLDGGNTFYKDDVWRAEALRGKRLDYLDVGASGGVEGRERGYCLTIGGEASAVARLAPLFRTIAPGRGDTPHTPGFDGSRTSAEEGWLHCGPAGAGHLVKMVHNGIEDGLMQAFAEGFDVLRNAGAEHLPPKHRFAIDVGQVAEVWRRGSAIDARLLDLAATALARNPDLTEFCDPVPDAGEGRFVVMAAVEEGVPAAVLSTALYARFRAREPHGFAEKLVCAMHVQSAGHVERATGG